MSTVAKTGLKLAVFTALMILMLVVINSAILRPIEGSSDEYAAMFTDANGLKVNDDVRIYGVQVGKVKSVEVVGSQAEIRFTVSRDNPIFDTTTLAIRFQTLAGQRYLDIRQTDALGNRLEPGSTIGTDQTVPAFDITGLFNGMRPVLAELSPESLNKFAMSVLAFIEGDGTGIGKVLDSIEEMSRYVSDRQAVIAALIDSLSAVTQTLDGRGTAVKSHLEGLITVFGNLKNQLPDIVQYSQQAPDVLGPIDRIAATFGLTPTTNPDFDRLIRLAIPDPDAVVDVLNRVPGFLQSLAGARPTQVCAKGNAAVPAPFSVLVAGERISVCNG